MIIIKHREKEPHKYCKASCPCGCVFVFDEIEFINYKTLGVCSTIRCPECHTEYVKGSSNIVPISVEEYAKYSGFALKNEAGLKNCPFCGSKWTQARYINHPFDEHHVYGGYRGECADCGVTTKAYKTREEAVDAWNMRSYEVTDENCK